MNEISSNIQTFASNYLEYKSSDFGLTEDVRILTDRVPNILYRRLGLSDMYKIKGSVGVGAWSEIPWVAILDTDVTNSTKRGYYVVLLFDKGLESIYLCLGVGWTQFKEEYGQKEGVQQIEAVGMHYANTLSDIKGFQSGSINLEATNGLGKGYERGTILSKKYKISNLSDSELLADIKTLLDLYSELKNIVGDSILNIDVDINAYIEEVGLFKRRVAEASLSEITDDSLLRLVQEANSTPPKVREFVRKEIVRSKKFADYVKSRAGYVCEICGRPPFVQKNNKPYAEADHVLPLGRRLVGLDSPDNMRCLCAQCHAVITYGSDDEVRRLLSSK